jgi:sugar phosphate isomerase/epimerase
LPESLAGINEPVYLNHISMKNCLYLLLCILSLATGVQQANSQAIPTLGVVESIGNDSLLYAAGFRLIGETVGKMLSPSLPEAAFEKNLQQIKQTRCKLYLCNVLFPGSIKITGSQVDEQKILGYLDTVFYRARRADIPLIVLGSGGSRRLPEGYDKAQAKREFAALCRKMAMVAKKHNRMLAIESLNSTETNFLNTLEEAAEIVKMVNHPNFRLNADIYHMLKENEPPQHIIDARKYIVYVELAEKEKRTFPGVAGEDFRPYFQALKSINYKGPIVIEGRTGNLSQEAPDAYNYLTKQLNDVYTGK